MAKPDYQYYLSSFQTALDEKIIPFWHTHGLDSEHGGIHTCLTREGQVYSQEKSVWMQGRGAWVFAYLYNVVAPDIRCKELAASALAFARKKCIDPVDRRMYFVVGTDGTPFRKRRYHFSEIFYIMANAEYSRLSGDEVYLQHAREYHDLLTTIHDDPSSDPYQVTPKYLSGAPQLRGLSEELMFMLATRILRIQDSSNRAHYLALEHKLMDTILSLHFNARVGTLLENVGPNGEYIGDYSSGRIVTPGHNLEAVWYLLREAEELGVLGSVLPRLEEIYAGAMQLGWDTKHGGVRYMVDVEGYAPQAYEHDMKLWWAHTEAILAALKLHRATGKLHYWDDFVQLLDWSLAHFNDDEFGEWYGYLHRDGQPTEPIAKGNVFKGPFHVPRMYAEGILELRLLQERDGQ